MCVWRRSQVAKAEVCKTFIQRFDSVRRLHTLRLLSVYDKSLFYFVAILPSHFRCVHHYQTLPPSATVNGVISQISSSFENLFVMAKDIAKKQLQAMAIATVAALLPTWTKP